MRELAKTFEDTERQKKVMRDSIQKSSLLRSVIIERVSVNVMHTNTAATLKKLIFLCLSSLNSILGIPATSEDTDSKEKEKALKRERKKKANCLCCLRI